MVGAGPRGKPASKSLFIATLQSPPNRYTSGASRRGSAQQVSSNGAPQARDAAANGEPPTRISRLALQSITEHLMFAASPVPARTPATPNRPPSATGPRARVTAVGGAGYLCAAPDRLRGDRTQYRRQPSASVQRRRRSRKSFKLKAARWPNRRLRGRPNANCGRAEIKLLFQLSQNRQPKTVPSSFADESRAMSTFICKSRLMALPSHAVLSMPCSGDVVPCFPFPRSGCVQLRP